MAQQQSELLRALQPGNGGFTKTQSPFQLKAPAPVTPPTVGPTLANAEIPLMSNTGAIPGFGAKPAVDRAASIAPLPSSGTSVFGGGASFRGEDTASGVVDAVRGAIPLGLPGALPFEAETPSAPQPAPSVTTPQITAGPNTGAGPVALGTPTSGSGIGTSVVNDVNFRQEGLRQAQGIGPAPQAPSPEPSFDGLTTAGGQPLAEFMAGGLQLDPQGRMIDPSVDRSSFEQESAAREQRAAEGLGEARGLDSRDRDRRGTMSKADAVKLTGGDRAAADALLKRQELGLGEFKVSAPSPADVLAREKWEASQTGEKPLSPSDALALRKYEDTLKKEADGVPLTPSEQLAREKFEFEKSKEPAKTATERNIERLMEANPDMSRSEAINIEQGAISKTVNPLTGATEMTNIATGESTPVKSTEPLPDSSLNLEPAEQGTSLFERGQKYTGAIEAGLRAGQQVAGQFGGKIVSDESTQTKKELDAFQGSLVRAFQEGDRFSTGQDKVLREELDATLGAMKDPETFKNNAIALDKVMRQRHADLIENYNDTTMDSNFRADSRAKARVLERAIRDLGVTQEAEAGKTAESVPVPEGVNKAFSQEMWDVLTPEERATLQGAK